MTRRPGTAIVLLVLAFPAATLAGDSTAISGPRLDWIMNCQGCHQADGAGVPGRVPPIKDHVSRFLTVDGGREFLIRVPGVSFSPLDDGRIAGLINWMVETFDPQHVPDDFRFYNELEVAAVRSNHYPNVAAVRAALVAKMRRGASVN